MKILIIIAGLHYFLRLSKSTDIEIEAKNIPMPVLDKQKELTEGAAIDLIEIYLSKLTKQLDRYYQIYYPSLHNILFVREKSRDQYRSRTGMFVSSSVHDLQALLESLPQNHQETARRVLSEERFRIGGLFGTKVTLASFSEHFPELRWFEI